MASPIDHYGDELPEEEEVITDAEDEPEQQGNRLHFAAAFAAEVGDEVNSGNDQICGYDDRVALYITICHNRGMNGPVIGTGIGPLAANKLTWFQTFVWVRTEGTLILISDLLRWLADQAQCTSYGVRELRKSFATAEQK